MKNILNTIGYILLLPFAGIAYKIYDGLRRKERDNPVKDIDDILRHVKKNTTYPDGWPDNIDFNSWSTRISKLNSNQN